MNNNDHDFTPCYVWPNEVIPFRVYYESKSLRIFIIENLQHNFLWLKKYKNKLRETDFFFVIVGCYYHDWLAKEANEMFEALNIAKSNFFILYNDNRDKKIFEKYGFCGDVINHNAWLDERLSFCPESIEKKYDAVYVSRLIEVKRHWLANSIPELAIVSGTTNTPDHYNTANWKFRNKYTFSPKEVALKINESYCGLILSDKEGACFASSEYLLCGIPVVSTRSEGGRDVWYDEYNSIIADDDEESIKNAVMQFVKNPRDPNIIRSNHVNLQYYFRSKFITKLYSLFSERECTNVSAVDYFWKHFIHKMRPYIKPDFEKIFQ